MRDFKEFIAGGQLCLTDGAINERVSRYPGLEADPQLAQTSLLYSEKGRAVLTEIYEGYFRIALEFELPMLTFAPTWKANRERIASKGGKYKAGNSEGILFLLDLRKQFESAEIYIGGDMGCKGDAYNPAEALDVSEAKEFHEFQCRELAASGADFLAATALPALSEAKGIAEVMSEIGIPYILSFIIRPNGNLLDDTPLSDAINEIDSAVDLGPISYLINCVHPSTMELAFQHLSRESKERILGLKANTSSRTPEELNNLDYLDTVAAPEFGRVASLTQSKLALQCIGGCCGTDDSHIRELARCLIASQRIS